MKKPKDKVVKAVNLEQCVLDKVDELADINDRSRSSMLNWLLKRQLGLVGDNEKG